MFGSTTRSIFPGAMKMRGLVGACLLVAAAGCASSGGGGGGGEASSPFDNAERGEQFIRVNVDNLNFNDVTIWAYRGGQRQRVGRMGGKAQQNFRVRWDFSQELRFEIQIVSQGDCFTNSIHADPGSHVRLLIPADINIGGRCQITRI